jgi:methyl-accepting chemotaxis protein
MMEKAGDMLTKLVPDIRKTADLVHEISAASREQESGVGQINKAVSQLDLVIQQNASSSEEMAATSEEQAKQAEEMSRTSKQLAQEADQLQLAVSYFKMDSSESNVKQVIIEKRRTPLIKKRDTEKIEVKTVKEKPAKQEETQPEEPKDDLDDKFEEF